MGQYVDFYCGNNNKELKQIVDYILKTKYVWIPQQEYDEFYSIASMVVWDCEKRFDGNKIKNQQFKSYLIKCIHNKIKTHITYMNRDKRMMKDVNGNPIHNSSLDAPIGEENTYLKDIIASDFKVENEADLETSYTECINNYLKILSPTQHNIAQMIMEDLNPSQIKERLNLTDKQYNNHLQHIRCDKNTSILTKTNIIENNEVEEKSMNNNQTFEKSKMEKLSIASIIKKMNNQTLRYDHPLQRASDQHSTKIKSNLISDILQGNPIPALVFAEQIINGISITWNLDGKQRSTNVKEFVEDKFKISRNVRRNIIRYQAMIKDANGETIHDENGFPRAEWREFNIKNKRFSQLPEELKDKFMDYCFDITLYINCSDEDIAYHIERYNDGKAMSGNQKSIIQIGEEYARMIKGIAAMPFFKENGFNYTQSKNGTIDRVCIETVMATEFLDKWKSSPEDNANFLKQNATEEHFDNLEDTVERLEQVMTNELGEMFDKKNSFIYFTVFARFKKTGLEDGKFIEFMTEYIQSIHNKFEEIETTSLNSKQRSTKDKSVVVEKIEFMENLMYEYLCINKSDLEAVSALDFIKENVKDNVENIDIEIYSNMLDDCVKIDSPIYKEENMPSLLAMIAYGIEQNQDEQVCDWLTEYAKKATGFITMQKQNYLHMMNIFRKGQVV